MAAPNSYKPAGDEYKSLRDEMNQEQQSVRMLWASAFGFYFTVLSAFCVVLTHLYLKDTPPQAATFLYQFFAWGGGNAMTTILLAIAIATLFLGYTWQRHSYYIGSYLQVFHEGFDSNFRWITLNRSNKTHVLRSVRSDMPFALANSMRTLAIIALLPTIVGIWYVSKQSSCYSSSFVETFVVVLVLIGLFLWRYRRLCALHEEQQQMTEAWQQIATPPAVASGSPEPVV